MTHRFRLQPEYIEMLRLFEFDGAINGQQVRRFRIFSPRVAREHNIMLKTSADLEQNPAMTLFEGYTDRQGNVYVADRRPPVSLATRASSRGIESLPGERR
ncbi:MAG: hypothetical protein HYX91_06160 [Chloroflexi bacterium]|nr:hypothetical protein [Chloroflexota bacterium]